MDRKITKHYSNDELTVVWQPHLCIHSAICFRGLPGVFDPQRKPWILLDGVDNEKLKAQIVACPSGALSYKLKNSDEVTVESKPVVASSIVVNESGPLTVKGGCEIVDSQGNSTVHDKTVFLCRCGASSNKPYCDGSHKKISFQG